MKPHSILNAIRLAVLPAIVSLTGCAVGPDYHRPDAVLPPAYSDAEKIDGRQTDNKVAVAGDEWWELVNDTVLDDLVDRAFQRN